MSYNFDFKVGVGDTLERVNLEARYHGVRHWTRPNRSSFWQLELLEVDLFVFSYWSVMRETIGFHVEYWFHKAFKRHDEITIEIRQLGRFNTLRETEVVDIVPIESYKNRKAYWDEKWSNYEAWKQLKYEIKPTEPTVRTKPVTVEVEIEKPIFYSVWNDSTKGWESILLKSSRLKKSDLILHKGDTFWLPPNESRSSLYLVRISTIDRLKEVQKIYS